MEKVIKTLKGHSGSTVTLKEGPNGVFVEKSGNVARNYERMNALKQYGWIEIPNIYMYDPEKEILQMEYIHGLDMKTYLRYYQPDKLALHISSLLGNLSAINLDHSESSENREDVIDALTKLMSSVDDLPFSSRELYSENSQVFNLERTEYIGDLSLDNIIWTEDRGFVHIDPVTVPYDNFIFDLAKLRQDIEFGWFIRNEPIDTNLEASLSKIREILWYTGSKTFDVMTIMMLLRVRKHCVKDTFDYNFITRIVNKLWDNQ